MPAAMPPPAPAAAAMLRIGCVSLRVPDALRAGLATRVVGGDVVLSLAGFSGELRFASACHACDGSPHAAPHAAPVLAALPGAAPQGHLFAPTQTQPHYLDGHDDFSDDDDDDDGRHDEDYWNSNGSDAAESPPRACGTPDSQHAPPAAAAANFPTSPPVPCPESDNEYVPRSALPVPSIARPPTPDDADEGARECDDDPVAAAAASKRLRDADADDGGNEVTADRGPNSSKRVRFTDGDVAPKAVDSLVAPWAAVAVAADSRVTPRWGATLTRLSDTTALLLGGENDDGGLFQDMHTLSLDGGRWLPGLAAAPTRAMPRPRAWHTATLLGGKVYVFGGEETDDAGVRSQVADMISLDLEYSSFHNVTPHGPVVPPPRGGHAACLIGDSIFIFGGIGGPGGSKWLSDSYLFDTATLSWTRCKPRASAVRPAARSYATMTLVNGQVVLFGGNAKTRSFGDVLLGAVERRNGAVAGIGWREPIVIGSAAPRPRTGHCAVACSSGDSLLVYGGWDDLGSTRIFFSDVWQLVFVSATECRWRCVHEGVQNQPPPSQPGKRAGAALCEAGEAQDALPLVFGGFRDFTQLNDVFKFDTPKCQRRA